jgi:hypothetical protein
MRIRLAAAAAAVAFAAGAARPPAQTVFNGTTELTRLLDPNGVFHRVFVIGAGMDASEDRALEEDYLTLQSALTGPAHQGTGSTVRVARHPSVGEFRAALDAAGRGAGYGDGRDDVQLLPTREHHRERLDYDHAAVLPGRVLGKLWIQDPNQPKRHINSSLY